MSRLFRNDRKMLVDNNIGMERFDKYCIIFEQSNGPRGVRR
jgi:hypothetical protein